MQIRLTWGVKMWCNRSCSLQSSGCKCCMTVNFNRSLNEMAFVEMLWKILHVCTLQTVIKVLWFVFGVHPAIPPLITHFFHPEFQKLSLSPVLQTRFRSDALLFSIPLPPSAICHSKVLTAKHLLWKDFKAYTLSEWTLSSLTDSFWLFNQVHHFCSSQ